MGTGGEHSPATIAAVPFTFGLGVIVSGIVRTGAFDTPDTVLVALAILGSAALAAGRRLINHQAIAGFIPFTFVWIALDYSRGGVDRSTALAGGVIAVGSGISLARASERSINVDGWLLAAGTTLNGIAVIGWLLRVEPIALVFDERYRLAGTMAYPNAAGLFAAISLTVSLTSQSPARVRNIASFVAATAVFGSLSRGSLLAMAVALVASRRSIRIRDLGPPVAGSVVAIAGIITSSSPAPQLTVVVLFVGGAALFAAVAPRTLPDELVRFLARVAIAAAIAVAVVALPKAGEAAKGRFSNASNEDRAAEWSAAMAAGTEHPWTGSGPERDLLITNFRGVAIARYAHNEFLQVFAGAGIIGLGLLVLGLASVGDQLRKDPRRGAGTVGIALALLVGGLVDFTWHFVALMAFAGLCLGRRRTE